MERMKHNLCAACLSVAALALSACGGDDTDKPYTMSPGQITADSGASGLMAGNTGGLGGPGGAVAGGAVAGSLGGGAGFDAGLNPIGGGGLDAQVARPDTGVVVPADGGTGTAGGGTGGGSTAAPCTGKPGAKRGKSSQTMMAGGLQRSFIYYAPMGLDPNKPVPLVIIPHGTNMSGEGMFDNTQYAVVADREKFVAIFPDGEDGPGSLTPWNVGDPVCGLGAVVEAQGNDQAFMDELIKFANADQCIDNDHIFMTGFSMGGYFSNENGCVNSKIRAVAPHSGGTHDLSSCPNKHKPVMVFHFKTDQLIDYSCGTDARDRWIQRNGCQATNPDVVPVKGGTCEYFKGCPADGQVAMCSFDDPNPDNSEAFPAGHAWSGGMKGGMSMQDFAVITGTESATELGWAFFKKYAW
jgi:polyhydroxybutyrate depolymerase